MTSIQQNGLSSTRIKGPPSVNVDLLECSICHDVLWKPVACQSCETPFCLACINQWLANNPNKCPNQCETYTERKCPPFIASLLAQLQISCCYQQAGCEQSEECPGCRSEVLKKDFDNHRSNCALIELTCQDCKFVYKRCDVATKHTENICLREQLRQLRDESKENKREMYQLTLQLNELRILIQRARITFEDLPSNIHQLCGIPSMYRGLKWTGMGYAHELFWKEIYPNSGYVTSFMSGGSPYIVYFSEEASITVARSNERFTFVSVTACAAWNDDLQFTIIGHRDSIQINIHTTTLPFGKPQLILLNWKDMDKVTFKSFGGTTHLGTDKSAGLYVVITQLTICSLDLKKT